MRVPTQRRSKSERTNLAFARAVPAYRFGTVRVTACLACVSFSLPIHRTGDSASGRPDEDITKVVVGSVAVSVDGLVEEHATRTLDPLHGKEYTCAASPTLRSATSAR